MLQKDFFAFLEADRVDDPLALDALQPRLEHLEPRGVDHDRNLRDLRLAGEKREELGHHLHAIEHSLVDVDVDDGGAVFDLLAGDTQRLLVALLLDQPGEGPRPRDVGPLADDRETGLRPNLQHLEPGVSRPPRRFGRLPRRVIPHRVGDRLDVGRCRAAAPPHDVEPAVLGVLFEHRGHHLGCLVEATECVGKACVGIATHEPRGRPR